MSLIFTFHMHFCGNKIDTWLLFWRPNLEFSHIFQNVIHLGSLYIAISKIKRTVTLNHESLCFSVIFWVYLAPGIRTCHLKLSKFFFFFFFFNLPWRKSCKIWWKIYPPMNSWKGGGKQPFTISVSKFILLEKKINNFIGSRCWHCVSYWRWKEFTRTIAVTKGIDGS